MICPNCESENKEGAKFCNDCGFPLTGRIATVAAATTNDEALRALEGLGSAGGAGRGEGGGAPGEARGDDAPGEVRGDPCTDGGARDSEGRDDAVQGQGGPEGEAPEDAGRPDADGPREGRADDAGPAAEEPPLDDEGVDEQHGGALGDEEPREDESVAEEGRRRGKDGAPAEGPESQPLLSGLPDPALASPDARQKNTAEARSGASGPLDRSSLPAIDVAGVNVDEDGRAFDFGPIEDDDEVEGEGLQEEEPEDAPPADDDLRPFVPRRAEDEAREAARSDLSGFDECLVDAGYVPPQKSWRSGDTMEMPRIDDQEPQQRRVLRAADPHDKKSRKEKKKNEKQAKKAQKAQKPECAQTSEKAEQKGGSPSGAPKKRRVRLPLVVLALVVVAGGVAAGVTYHYELWGGKMLPNVVGMTQADACDILEDKGFTVRETKVKSDETEGIVLLMDPGAGAREEEGSEVTIHVSQARTIPDVVGAQRDAAAAQFAADGFENVAFDDQKSDEQEGSVLGVDPAAGQKAQAKTAITVTVAVPYTVPDVSGMSYDQAKAAIEQAGLAAQLVYSYNDKVSEGTILGTDPAAGTKVGGGSTVSVSVARSRANELVAAAQSYLASAGTININGSPYLIQSVDAVSYQGKDTTAFTVTAAAVTTLDGETVHGSYKQRNGVIVWNSSNKIVSIS